MADFYYRKDISQVHKNCCKADTSFFEYAQNSHELTSLGFYLQKTKIIWLIEWGCSRVFACYN